jgi:hypothetical protein
LALLLALAPALRAAEVETADSEPEAPVSEALAVEGGLTLDDGTVQGFSLGVDKEGAVLGFTIRQRPEAGDSAATGAILYAIPADSGIPKTLHLQLRPVPVVGEQGSWNFDAALAGAVKEKRFPAVLASGSMITVQLLRGRKGVSVGTPMSAVYGEAVETKRSPARGSSGCRAGECFAQRFRKCTQAVLEAATRIDLAYRYEVVGPEKKGCRVRSTYLKHPNETWSGKSMECLYDSSKPFEEALNKPVSCKGPLYDAMRRPEPADDSAY